MSYDVTDATPRWRTKPLKGVDPASFEVLHPLIAVDATQVLFVGKPVKVDRAGFEVLGAGFARNHAVAFQIAPTKLKPLKCDNPAGLTALSETYAATGDQLFYKDRAVKLKPLPEAAKRRFRALHDVFATDGIGLYFGSKQCQLEPKKAAGQVDFAQLRLRVFGSFAEYNIPEILVDDGTRQFWTDGVSTPQLISGQVDFESFHAPGVGQDQFDKNREYLRADRNRVYYDGYPLPEGDPGDLKLLGGDVYETGGQVYAGVHRIDGVKPGTWTWLDDEIFTDGTDLFVISGGRHRWARQQPGSLQPQPYAPQPYAPQPYAPLPEPPSGPLSALVQSGLVPLMVAILNQLDKRVPAQVKQKRKHLSPIGWVQADDLVLTLDGATLTAVLRGGPPVHGPLSGFYRICCQLWAQSQGRADTLFCFPPLGRSYPKASRWLVMHLQETRLEALPFLAVLYREGTEDARRQVEILTFLLTNLIEDHFRGGSVLQPQTLALLPPDLISQRRYTPRWHKFENTTNQAVGKHIVSSGLMEDSDPRVRLEMADQLHSVVLETGAPLGFFKAVLPAVMARQPNEPVALVADLLAHVIDAGGFMAMQKSELGNRSYYAEAVSVVRWLVENRVNYDLNRTRLIKILTELGELEEAAELKAQLQTEFAD